MREPSGRQIRRVHRPSVTLASLAELLPQRPHGFPEHAAERARSEVGNTAGRGVGQRGELLGAEAIGQILMEVPAVGVRRVAGGPSIETAGGAIHRLESMVCGRDVDDRAKISRGNPPLARHAALLERRNPLNLPDRKKGVRKDNGNAAEHTSEAFNPPARPIEVQDVRVLVREDQLQPVGRVAPR